VALNAKIANHRLPGRQTRAELGRCCSISLPNPGGTRGGHYGPVNRQQRSRHPGGFR